MRRMWCEFEFAAFSKEALIYCIFWNNASIYLFIFFYIDCPQQRCVGCLSRCLPCFFPLVLLLLRIRMLHFFRFDLADSSLMMSSIDLLSDLSWSALNSRQIDSCSIPTERISSEKGNRQVFEECSDMQQSATGTNTAPRVQWFLQQ